MIIESEYDGMHFTAVLVIFKNSAESTVDWEVIIESEYLLDILVAWREYKLSQLCVNTVKSITHKIYLNIVSSE